MSGMTIYYASRAVFSVAFALLFAVTGMELWLAAVPNSLLEAVLLLGFLVYLVSDWMLRRTSA